MEPPIILPIIAISAVSVWLIYVIIVGHMNTSRSFIRSGFNPVAFNSSQYEWKPDKNKIKGHVTTSFDVTLNKVTYHPIVSIYEQGTGWKCIDLSIKTFKRPDGTSYRRFMPEYSEGEAQLIIYQFIFNYQKP